jgi:hypothetical protein
MSVVLEILISVSLVICVGLLGGGYRVVSKWVFGGSTAIVKFMGYCLFGSHMALFVTYLDEHDERGLTFMVALSILIIYLGIYYIGVEILRDIMRKRYKRKNGRNN